jgi:uncharacterized protein
MGHGRGHFGKVNADCLYFARSGSHGGEDRQGARHMTIFEFSENTDSREILCRIFPGPAPEITSYKLRKAWDGSEFNGCFVFEDRIQPAITETLNAIVAASRQATASISTDIAPSTDAVPADDTEPSTEPPPTIIAALTEFVIAERRDATCSIAVTEDHMGADAIVVAPWGGNVVEESLVLNALRAADVCFGLDTDAIKALVDEAGIAAPGSTLKKRLANATEPSMGTPSRFENLVIPFQDRVLKPRENADGSIDFHDLGAIETVETGAELVRRYPALPGANGTDVFGKTIPARTPEETPFTVGEGAALDTADPFLLRAARAGVPHRVANGMSVDDVLQVAEVDLRVGNVDFEGSLVVKGDVRAGLKIKVGKDLIVGGFIDCATVEAGGDVTIKQGIIGPATPGSELSCSIRARNITAHYAQNSQLHASEDIALHSHLLNCDVRDCRSVRVGDKSQTKARLAGGSVRARLSVESGVIGAVSEAGTQIHMDAGLQELRQLISAEQMQHAQLDETVVGLEKSAQQIEALPPSEALADKLTRIRNTIAKYQDEMQLLQAGIEEKKLAITEQIANARVVAHAHAYSGVELHCLDVHRQFHAEQGGFIMAVRDDAWTQIDG